MTEESVTVPLRTPISAVYCRVVNTTKYLFGRTVHSAMRQRCTVTESAPSNRVHEKVMRGWPGSVDGSDGRGSFGRKTPATGRVRLRIKLESPSSVKAREASSTGTAEQTSPRLFSSLCRATPGKDTAKEQ